MDILYPRCAGLDVHKDVVVACVRCVSPPAHQEVRHFATTTTGLLAGPPLLLKLCSGSPITNTNMHKTPSTAIMAHS